MIIVLALVLLFALAGTAAFLYRTSSRDETIAAMYWGVSGILAIMMGAA